MKNFDRNNPRQQSPNRPLWDRDAERQLLASILINPAQAPDAVEYVKAEWFGIPEHRTIFEAVSGLVDSGGAVDAAGISSELERRGKLSEVGGYEYLQELVNLVPHGAHARAHAKTVREWSIRRKEYLDASERARRAMDLSTPLETIAPEECTREVIASARKGLCDAAMRRAAKERPLESMETSRFISILFLGFILGSCLSWLFFVFTARYVVANVLPVQ